MVGAFGGSVGRFHGPREGEPREDSRRVDVAASARTRLSFPAARRGEVSDRASPEGCQIKGRPRFTRDDGVSPGRPPPENGAFARDATYLGAFRDARVFRGGDLRVVKGRERSATATRPSRRASVAEGSRTRCDVVRGGNAGGVRLGARRERRRTMMGDSYFTSVSTGGIGMAPGLLRRKRPARRSLSQSTRARPHSTNSAFRVSAVCRVELLRRASPRWKIRVAKRNYVWAFTLRCRLTFTLCPAGSPMAVRARGERVTAQRAALIRVFARQGPDHAPRASSRSVRRARAAGRRLSASGGEAGASPIVRGGERMADLLDNPHAVLDGQVRDRAC